jgi:acetyl esterase/lipase
MSRTGFWSVAALVALLGAVLAFRSESAGQEKKQPPLPEGVRAERDLVYGPHGERNKLDLYLPKSETPLPLIIWVHGGGWSAGSKDNPPGLDFLAHGYALASINYRLSQMAKFPAQIEDCKAAVRFLRANAKKYNLDPEHFGAWGASAGGHLVALLGTTGHVKELEGDGPNQGVSSRVQAVCDVFGPTDFLVMQMQSGGKGRFNHDAADSPEAKLLGGPIQDDRDRAGRANPIRYIRKDCPPFLILHGDKDDIVPAAQSRILHEALQAAGVESTLIIVEGAGHGPGVNTPENLKKTEAFFDRHLRKKANP